MNVQDYYARHNTDVAWKTTCALRGATDPERIEYEHGTPARIAKQMGRAHRLIEEHGKRPQSFTSWREARQAYRRIVRREQRRELQELRQMRTVEAGR